MARKDAIVYGGNVVSLAENTNSTVKIQNCRVNAELPFTSPDNTAFPHCSQCSLGPSNIQINRSGKNSAKCLQSECAHHTPK